MRHRPSDGRSIIRRDEFLFTRLRIRNPAEASVLDPVEDITLVSCGSFGAPKRKNGSARHIANLTRTRQCELAPSFKAWGRIVLRK